jgi:ERCC4-type nuclease
VGDYAIDGDDRFAIERKSLDDFVGTVFSGWERFVREIGRMEGAGFVARVVIIEADYDMLMMTQGAGGEIIAPCHHHPMITPQAVAGRIADLTMMGVSCLFCRDAGHAALQAYHLFCRRAAQIANESLRR